MLPSGTPSKPISLPNENRGQLVPTQSNDVAFGKNSVVSLAPKVNESAPSGRREDDLPYAGDDEDFLQLVPKTYSAYDLFEWQPPPPIKGDPNEPGYNGKSIHRYETEEIDELIRGLVSNRWIKLRRPTFPLTGSAVVVPPERLEEAKQRFELHQFNVVASEMMAMNRSYPDMRDPKWVFI